MARRPRGGRADRIQASRRAGGWNAGGDPAVGALMRPASRQGLSRRMRSARLLRRLFRPGRRRYLRHAPAGCAGSGRHGDGTASVPDRQSLRGLGLSFELSPLEPAQLPFEAAAGWSAGVWMPSSGRYETAAAVSACGDFLARRTACRCRQEGERRPRPAEAACGTADLSVLLRALLENGRTAAARPPSPRFCAR